jgi:hypothetical protein
VTLNEIRRRIAEIRTEARAQLGGADSASPESAARVEALMTELDGLETQERTLVRLDEMDRRAAGTPIGNTRRTPSRIRRRRSVRVT